MTRATLIVRADNGDEVSTIEFVVEREDQTAKVVINPTEIQIHTLHPPVRVQ